MRDRYLRFFPLFVLLFAQAASAQYYYAISPASIPNAQLNTSYSAQFSVVSSTIPNNCGDVSPSYGWAYTGSLPPGLSLDSNYGTLAGIPTSPGSYPFQISYTYNDSNYCIVTANYNMTIAGPSGALALTGPVNLGTIVLGKWISGGVTASGGTGPYTFTATGVPPGMTFSGGAIKGTPTAPGLYNVGVTVTDAQQATATSTISLSVFGIVPSSIPPAVTSSPYSFFITAAGGAQPYAFSASGVPPGFSFSGQGWLNGTASTTGKYTLAVTVTDANGVNDTVSFPFAVTVPPPLQVPGGPLSNITVLNSYSQTLSATGGAPPYSWTLVGGSLPDGMGLRSSGTISGTPDKIGSYTFSARATDVTGASGVGAFSFTVGPPSVSITTPTSLASGMVTVDYPVQILSATGGVGPYTFTVPASTLPSGLTLSSSGAISGTPTTIGSFTFTVTATDTKGQTSTATFLITVRPFSVDLITSAGSLAFTLSAGATALPGTQAVQVQSTDVTKILNYSTVITPAATWLSVSPAITKGLTTPGSFTISLTNAALALAASATPYQTTVAVTCLAPSPCAGNVQTVAVSLAVSVVPPQLTVLTDLLAFTTPSSAPQATSQALGVQNTGGGSVGFASATCPPVWCKVSSIPSSLAAGVTGSIGITADPTGLNPGYYYTDLTIVSSVGTTAVPITFFIADNSSLELAPSGVELTMPAGGVAASPDTSFRVSVSGTSALAWTATVLPGAPWLKLGTTSGTSTGAIPGSVSYSIDPVAAAALTSQAYYGTIRVVSAGAVNSPQDFQVVLNVTAPAGKQQPNPTPAGLIFLTTAAGTPPPQIDQVFASSVAPVNYQASAETADGNSWLSVSPATGSTSASAPAQTLIAVSPAGLATGIYHGNVSYSLSAAAVRTVNVTLVVQAPGQTASLRPATAQASSCTPSQLIPTQTGLVNNFAAPASWPTPLEITLLNDCGSPVTTAQIVATFSNGDPPLVVNLANAAAGTYSGTWTPRKTGSQVTITAQATAPGYAVATAQISGSVVPNVAPVLNHNGTLHVFTPQVGAPLAPGTILQIYGSSLANQTLVNTTIPLANSLGGTSVIIGGLTAPLFFVSPGQVNALLPFELAPGQPYQVIVSNNGALTTPDSIQTTAVTPGVAALASGLANAQHAADASGVTEASPAKPGEYIVIYLAGMGVTTVPVASGAGSPSSPLAQTQGTPSITLNGEPVSYLFSGLTPGLAGLYQIDLQIPSDAPNGDLTLVVDQPGYQGTSVILPVHQ